MIGVADSAAPQRDATYSYTDAGRLASATGIWGADSYTWDANDNRVRADRTLGGSTASDVATLAPGTNRLSELRDAAGVLSRSFSHTPGGDTSAVNRVGAPALGYSYDARGRLSGVSSGGTTIAAYAYDWREQRVMASSVEVGSRHYLYGEDGRLLAEHDGATGALVREYVWLDTMPLALVSGPAATPAYTWITSGNLGEPLLLTDASGALASSVTRDPWGNPVLLAGGVPLELGYPGQWKDPATGLFQNHHRDYDSTTGRYVQADPLGLGGGSNVYAYVGGDPMNLVDPRGLRPSSGAVVRVGVDWYVERQVKKAATRRIPIVGPALSIGDALGAAAAVAIFLCNRDDPKPDCRKASPWELRRAGISDEHRFKIEHGYSPASRFDICVCRDGSVRIAPQGMCGRAGWDDLSEDLR